MKKHLIILLFIIFFTQKAFSIESSQLPGSVLPGVGKQPTQPIARHPLSMPHLEQKEANPNLGEAAKKIKFKLTKIVLIGNHIYSTSTLEALYKKQLNKQISVADLQKMVQNITNYYRNNGYILSRALLPPQKIQNGVVKIQIVEGFLANVNITGHPWKRTIPIMQAYGEKMKASRPLQLNVLEHYLRIANEVPGAEVRSVLEPSKKTVGASDLDLIIDEKVLQGSIGYNNQGTRYIGPQQMNVSLAANSIFTSGDTTRLIWSGTPARPKEMKYYDLSYTALLGSNGLNVTGGKSYSLTHAGFTLQPAKIQGTATTYYVNASYPMIRARDASLTLNGGFSYLDSTVTSLGTLLYIDHLRVANFGGIYSFADRLNGVNNIDLHLRQGLNLAGSTTNTHSTLTSRFGGSAVFTKLTTLLSRQQPIYGRYSVFAQFSGQYAHEPLLASEQFTFGGSQFGRAYDSAELIGDRGMAGSVELRANFLPDKFLLQFIQPFIFYDEGVIWNIKNLANTKQKQSAASTGFGINFAMNKYVSGSVYIAQPLTRVVDALEILGRGRRPRAFFSINVAD